MFLRGIRMSGDCVGIDFGLIFFICSFCRIGVVLFVFGFIVFTD